MKGIIWSKTQYLIIYTKIHNCMASKTFIDFINNNYSNYIIKQMYGYNINEVKK